MVLREELLVVLLGRARVQGHSKFLRAICKVLDENAVDVDVHLGLSILVDQVRPSRFVHLHLCKLYLVFLLV